MAKRRIENIASTLSERFASTWKLLSDTTYFLSRTSLFLHYEAELIDMRKRLSSSGRNSEVEKTLRKELTELRKALRLQGYDLSLGHLELSFQGFRNDASIMEGFSRIVLFIGRSGLWWITGDDNHIELYNRLDAALGAAGIQALQKHYLWYRWNHDQLILSGSDTESSDDFDTLRTWADQPERRLLLLSRLKKLRSL